MVTANPMVNCNVEDGTVEDNQTIFPQQNYESIINVAPLVEHNNKSDGIIV